MGNTDKVDAGSTKRDALLRVDLSELDDADLLAAVAEGPPRARPAQAELYGRHVRFLYGVLLKTKRELLAMAHMSAEDLAQETFRRAFSRAGTFDRAGLTDPDRLRRRTRAWLGRIATNLLADAVERTREVSASDYLERLTDEEPDEDVTAPESPQLRQMQHCLGHLSERERDVVLVSALYFRAGEEHQRLTNAASQELATRWETTSTNVRAIRSRAMKKLKTCLDRAEGGAS